MNLDLNFFTSDYFDIDVTLEIREKFKSKLLSYYLRPKQFGCDILMYKIIELMLHVVVVKLKSVISVILSTGFDFVQKEYARAITEYHAVNKTVMHIRAVGCEGPVKYTIAQPDTPFKIDEKGHVWLVKRLNYDKASSYLLNVTAEAGDGKCIAYTKIHFEVLNMNKHAPQFEFEKYSCDIIENTREMRFNPPMRVLDSDSGKAGKISSVKIVESGLPFVFTVDEKGNVQGRATKNMDAEDITDYFFDIIAWDSGEPSKSSFPISLECEVDDVNEFGPHFTPDTYQAKIARGKTYSNITQVCVYKHLFTSPLKKVLFILCTLMSVCLFSILFSIHFLMCWQGEFV